MIKLYLPAATLFASFFVAAQGSQTEFVQPFISHLRIASGAITRFDASPDRYALSLQWVPQVLLAKGSVRGGAVFGSFYGDKAWGLMGGPTVSLRLKTFNAGTMGSLGNLNLSLDHLWASDKRRLAGGGLQIDALNKIMLGLHTHRDYEQGEWWFAISVAVRTSRIKKVIETVPH